MTVIVSANVNEYDSPKTHVEQSVPCKLVALRENYPDHHDVHPRTIAKLPKFRPWRYAEDEGPWIWIDGSAEIISPTFVEEVLEATHGPLGQFVHPHRDCIYPEATVSATMMKYDGVPVLEQANHYRRIGHPAHWGLWATGVIVYKERLDYFADLWWAELNRWGYQDQISEPVALRAAGLEPSPLPYALWDNPWIKWHGHRRDV